MDVFICLDVSVSLKRAYWREYQVIMTEISQSLVRSARTDTSTTCKKTHNSILIFFFILCRKKTIPKIYRKLTILFTPFLTWFLYRLNQTQLKTRTNPDFVYICKSNHTSHLLAHVWKREMFEQTSTFWTLNKQCRPHRQKLPLK